MSLILNIDTATEQGSISLARNGVVLGERSSLQQKDHASWIQVAIKNIMELANCQFDQLNTVAVVAGPGSYTGLRVGMATAKGLCYALNIPMVQLNTLLVMTYAVASTMPGKSLLYCPMLDARRMEVYTALYDAGLNEVLPPMALSLEKNSFAEWTDKYKIVFFGNGVNKWKHLSAVPDTTFSDIMYAPNHIALLSYEFFKRSAFSNLAYAEPIYLKEFYTHQKN